MRVCRRVEAGENGDEPKDQAQLREIILLQRAMNLDGQAGTTDLFSEPRPEGSEPPEAVDAGRGRGRGVGRGRGRGRGRFDRAAGAPLPMLLHICF